MTYRKALLKRKIEEVFMSPFVWLGKLLGRLFPLSTQHQVFLFFPNGDIGGSPQVNIDLTHCIRDTRPIIIFSKKPSNNQFREMYNIPGVRVLDLHKWIDKKYLHFINFFYRGVLASWINKQKSPVVFGGESLFFYKMVPHLKPNVLTVELCHLDTWLPYSIGFIDKINKRCFSTEKLKQKVEAQYRENNLPESYFSRLFFLDNAIDFPGEYQNHSPRLQVFYIGRGSPQKRVPLIAEIASSLHQKNAAVDFSFVGDVEKVIDPVQLPFCTFYGNVKSQDKMQELYKKADVLLMTSAFEGLPVVIMQMMAHGKVVVSTPVGGIPDYIFDNLNGLILNNGAEPQIVEDGIKAIEKLASDIQLRERLGAKSREIAIQKFSREAFCRNYRKLLELDQRLKT
ncbi:MAG: glycosyltransferase family 4 protein [Chitinophagaceae bacterium]|nr:glycosyltransferase family 4 protein [Chitinophagaceae bacterium]MCW5916642.1 glycosyltransferase family 4 protein [Ferruginibacter sp.]